MSIKTLHSKIGVTDTEGKITGLACVVNKGDEPYLYGSATNLIFGIPENANRVPIEIDEKSDTTKMRARFRNDDFAKIWLKTSCGIRAFYLGWTEDKSALKPCIEMAANYRKSI